MGFTPAATIMATAMERRPARFWAGEIKLRNCAAESGSCRRKWPKSAGAAAHWRASKRNCKRACKQRNAANTALTESKVSLAAEEQLSASFSQQQESLEQRISELSQTIEQRKAELSSFDNRKGVAESEIQESRSQIERLQHEREQVN